MRFLIIEKKKHCVLHSYATNSYWMFSVCKTLVQTEIFRKSHGNLMGTKKCKFYKVLWKLSNNMQDSISLEFVNMKNMI